MSETSRSTRIVNETQKRLRGRGRPALEAALNGLIVAAIDTPAAVMAAAEAAGASAAAAAQVMIDAVQKADTAARDNGAVREASRNEATKVVLTYVKKHSEVLLPFLYTKSITGLVIRDRSYCIQMTRELGADSFEGFVNKDGNRDGKGRYTWADGTIGLCSWSNGRCCSGRYTWAGGTSRLKSQNFSKLERQQYYGMCVKCENLCSEFTFKCLNCETAYCESCEKKTRDEGFKKRRPPCKCLIDTKGIAVQIQGTALDLSIWKPVSVIELYQQGRQASAKIQDLIFVIEFVRKGELQHHIKALCHIGSLEISTQSQLLKTKEIQEYVKKISGSKPPAFIELEQLWHKPPQPYPKISLNTAENPQDWSSVFSTAAEDVDSLDIKNFNLTVDSIKNQLPELLQTRQVEIGRGWSAVNPRKGHCIICGPRPTLIVYMGGLNMNVIRQTFARHLHLLTGKVFTTAQKGKSIFQQSNASVDVTALMTAWLQTVQDLQSKDKEDDAEHQKYEKMKLLQIIYHGWKSAPNEIDQFPQADDSSDNDDLWTRCKEGQAEAGDQNTGSDESCDFEATFDLAQKYVFIRHSALTRENCMSHVRVPVFGILKTIPGFKAHTWSMFGPLPPGNMDMGSIKLDRTGTENDIFPENVKRVKIYPGVVNLLKHFMNQGLNGKTLTKKRLDGIRKTFTSILAEMSSPKCIEHADMLMSFRIEFTMALNESHKNLKSLRDELHTLKTDLLKILQPFLKSSIIALEDIQMFSQWGLSRYNKICKGKSNTPFDDQSLAKDLVLSLWHGAGYHQFRFTQRKHKDYLVDLDMTGYDTDDDDNDELVAKHAQQKIDWSLETETAIETIMHALQYMNIINVATENDGTRLRYMYRRICDFDHNTTPCHWCYSEKACKNVAEHPEKHNLRKKSNYACKSKDFDTSIELVEDVFKRLKHHHDISSNGCMELMQSMFVAARERTKEQKKVLKEMTQLLNIKCPKYNLELFNEFDKSDEGNQDALLSKGGKHRQHVEWSQLTNENMKAILQALTYMNIFKPKRKVLKQNAKTGSELLSQPDLLQYMYKKVCNFQTGIETCSWCYSDAACKNFKTQNLGEFQSQKRIVACKSNIFETAEALIEDVCGRLQHHNNLCSDDWNRSLKEMLFPIQEKNKPVQENVLKAMHQKIQNFLNRQSIHQSLADLSVDDVQSSIANGVTSNVEKHGQDWDIDVEDELCLSIEFKSSEHALIQLCREMHIAADIHVLPDSWKRSEHCSSYIKLNDCIYSSQPFAKGNAECHVGWCPRTKKPLCVKVIPVKDDDTELDMLHQVQKHTRGQQVKHNLVQFIGHEDQCKARFLKFEFIEPRDCFKKDLESLELCQVTVYMRELLRALTYLHKNCAIIHRDVKPDNFVHHFASGVFRLIDFGSAEYYNQRGLTATKFKKGGGTRGFRAPEKLHQKKTKDTPAVDVWSAGIILLSLLTGMPNILSHQGHKVPGEKCDETHLREIGIIVGNEEMRKLNVECNYGEGCQYAQKTGWAAKALKNVNSKRTWTPDDQALDLLSKMLQVLPSQRITSEAALNHPFLREDSRIASGTSNVVAAEAHDLLQQQEQQKQQQRQQPPLQRDSELTSNSATGLPNDTRWCYLNSVLQCLRQSTDLTSQITSTSNTYQLIKNDSGCGIAHRLRTFLTNNEKTHILQELNALRKQLRIFDKKFDGTSHECASEVCQTMLNAMLTAHAPTSQCPHSPARVAQYGTKATMKCRRCSREWEGATDEGTVISMALASDNTLQSSIEAWLQYNPLENVQCAHASCDAMTVDRKWNLYTAPDVMIIALNIQYSKKGEKLLNTVHSGDTVDVDKHRYEIFGVVSHIGRTRNHGHYIAHTKRNGNWNFFDDSIVISNRHWRSNLGQHETPCMFFLRNIPQKERQQCSYQHQASQQNDSLFVKKGSPSMADNSQVAGNKDAGVSFSLIADESNQKASLQQEHQDQFVGTNNESADTVTGSIQDPITAIGKNVLARRDAHSQWSPAFVQDGTEKEYKVVFWAVREECHVTADNIKQIDWKYWNTVLKSWTCDEFDEAIDGSNIEDDAHGNIVALANLEIGDVVAKRTGLNAFADKDGQAESKEQCNSILWSVDQGLSAVNNKAVFLVTTKLVQRGEKLKWFHKSQSILCDLSDKDAVTSSAESNEHACTGNSDNVKNNESQPMLESRKFCIDRTYMKKVKQHFSKDKSVKLLEALLSYNDTFEARLPKNTKSATALLQARQRNERHSKSSAIEESAVPNSENESAALGYAESTWTTVQKMINLFDEELGSSIPAYYLDIGSGSLAHCAIAASASGRFLVCDGIEYGLTRFQASQKSLMSAQNSGILKSPCKIVHGDVLTSRDIELSTYNVYSFFDKVCIEVSQQTLQRVILEHYANNFALGPIMYLTCMGSNELKEALDELQTKMTSSEWNSLAFLNTESMSLTTRFARQRFKCTLVQVRKKG